MFKFRAGRTPANMASAATPRRRKESLENLVERVEQFRQQQLTGDRLNALHDEVQNKQSALLAEARLHEADLSQHIQDKKMMDFETHHAKLRQIKRRFDRLETMRNRIFDRYQEQRIEEGLHRRLGRRGTTALRLTVLVLIGVVLAILFVEHFESGLEIGLLWTFFAVDTAACAVFITEFFLRFSQAESKRWYWRKHWIDLVSSIPLPPDPLTTDVRWVRMVRLIRLLRIMRALRILAFLWRGMDGLERVTDVRLMKKTVVWIVALVLAGGLMVHGLEGGPGDAARSGNPGTGVDTVGDGLWWSFTTLATGGFADLYNPSSAFARAITGVLILAGAVVVSVLTATLTMIYQGETAEEIRYNQHELRNAVEALKDAREQPAEPE